MLIRFLKSLLLLSMLLTAMAAPALPNFSDFSSRANDAHITIQMAEYDARTLGVKWDNVTNDAPALNAAIVSVGLTGGGVIVLPPGTGKVSGQVTFTNGVTLRGSGVGTTRMDMTAASPTDAFIYAPGSQTALPAIASDVALGATTITFASAHGLVVGDVYVLWNATDYSFSSDRADYRAGECYKVVGVNGTTVTNSAPSWAAYTAGANIQLYKKALIQACVQDMTIRVKPGVLFSALKFVHATGLLFNNIDISGSQLAQIDVDRSYNVRGGNGTGTDFNVVNGNNYGLSVNSTQIGEFGNITFWGPRHGSANGGYGLAGSIPVRSIKYYNLRTEAYGSAGDTGIDAHGNSEYIEWHNCSSPSGIDMGGDHHKVIGGFFGNYNDNHEAFLIAHTTGMDFEINGVNLYANQSLLSAVGLGYVIVLPSMTKENQVVRFNDCKIDLGPYTGDSVSTFGLMFEPSASATTEKYGIEVNNLTVTSTYTNNIGTNFVSIYGLNIAPGDSKGFRSVRVNGGSFINCGVRVRENIQNLELKNFTILNAVGDAILSAVVTTPSFTDQRWALDNIYNTGAQGTINLLANTNATIFVNNVKSFNNAHHLTSSSSVNSSIYLAGFNEVFMYNNTFGDTQTVPTQQRAWGVETTTLHRNNNSKVGSVTAVSEITAITLVTDFAPASDANYIYWNETSKTMSMGIANTDNSIPLWVRRSTNAIVQLILDNNNGGSASATYIALNANDSGGILANYPSTTAGFKADSFGLEGKSTMGKMLFNCPTAGQIFEFRAPGGVLAAQINGTNTLVIGGTATDNVNATNGVIVGAGTLVKKMLTATATLDFPSVAAQSSQDLTITVTGSATTDAVFLGPPSTVTSGIQYSAFVSSGNTVTVRANNFTAGAIDPASATFRASVLSY